MPNQFSKELSKEQREEARRLAGLLRSSIGSEMAAKKLNIVPNAFRRYSMGMQIPTLGKFRKMAELAKEYSKR
jgi:hypothetical protein